MCYSFDQPNGLDAHDRYGNLIVQLDFTMRIRVDILLVAGAKYNALIHGTR